MPERFDQGGHGLNWLARPAQAEQLEARLLIPLRPGHPEPPPRVLDACRALLLAARAAVRLQPTDRQRRGRDIAPLDRGSRDAGDPAAVRRLDRDQVMDDAVS